MLIIFEDKDVTAQIDGGTTNMEWTSCELGDIFEEGSVTCLREFDLCLRCSGGIWEPVDCESEPDAVKEESLGRAKIIPQNAG